MMIFISMSYNEVKKCCENCSKPLVLRNNRDITKKRFCSKYCSSYYTTIERQRKNPDLFKRFYLSGFTQESNSKKGNKKENHPLWKGGDQTHICQNCKSPFTVTINKSNKGYGKFCSRKCYIQNHQVDNIKSKCLNCGKDIWDKPKKNRQYCSCSCRAIYLLPKQKTKNTGIELKIKSFLESKNISFKPQPYIKGIVNADFSIQPNILIFADGDYWHSLPKAVKRDSIVNRKLKENNYIVLRFKEKDINNNFVVVENKILEVVNAGAQ